MAGLRGMKGRRDQGRTPGLSQKGTVPTTPETEKLERGFLKKKVA